MCLYLEKRDIQVYNSENKRPWLGATRMDGMQGWGGVIYGYTNVCRGLKTTLDIPF